MNCFTPLAVEQCLTPPWSCATTLFLWRDHGGVIHRRVLDGDAEGVGVFDAVQRFGGGDERLGGNAAPVQAGAAELFLFDDGDRCAKLRGADGGGIAAGPAPMTTMSNVSIIRCPQVFV